MPVLSFSEEAIDTEVVKSSRHMSELHTSRPLLGRREVRVSWLITHVANTRPKSHISDLAQGSYAYRCGWVQNRQVVYLAEAFALQKRAFCHLQYIFAAIIVCTESWKNYHYPDNARMQLGTWL
jgi:hypothetical protein